MQVIRLHHFYIFLLNHFPGGFSTYPICCCVWNAWPGKLPARPESWSVHVHQTDHSIFNLHVWFDIHFCTYTYIIYIYDRFILQYTYVIICVIIYTLNCIYAFRWKRENAIDSSYVIRSPFRMSQALLRQVGHTAFPDCGSAQMRKKKHPLKLWTGEHPKYTMSYHYACNIIWYYMRICVESICGGLWSFVGMSQHENQ